MNTVLIPYQQIALSAPFTGTVHDYKKFVAPQIWKPRDQNVMNVKSFQAGVLKLHYESGPYDNGDVDTMSFVFRLEGSSDGSVYMTLQEWTLEVKSAGTLQEKVWEIPLVGISYVRPVLSSIDLRGKLSVYAQLYMKS